ncbi:MAG TPA: Gfo/Idh/MocA family oxidoreductase [Acidimicrobiia bacterium]|nr:Gfo/Idh/MocA family oxidoreductase [Acidimicrobiia bacterium]
MSDAPRVLVAGAGSIGRRHCANLRAAGAVVTVLDPDAARVDATVAAVGAIRGECSAQIPGGYDGVVIASPTVLHAEQAAAAVATGARVLVEKPLACAAADVPVPVADGAVAVGYNLRFVAPLQRLIGGVQRGDIGDIASVRVWFGSWLPGWRAGDYRASYSAQRALGGGVLLDAIHELDELVWLFGDGELTVAGALVQRLGDLDIDVEDSVHALLQHASGVPVHVALDYLSRDYRRGIEVVGTRGTIRYDWASERLELEALDRDRLDETVAPDVDEAYRREARAFLGWIDGGPTLPVPAPVGMESLRLADAIRAHGTR